MTSYPADTGMQLPRLGTKVESMEESEASTPFLKREEAEAEEIEDVEATTESPSRIWVGKFTTFMYFAVNIISTVAIVFLNKL